MSDFKMSVSEFQGATVVKLDGSLELAACGVLDRGLIGVSARKPKLLIFDLTELTFISSLAMGSIVGARGGVVRAGGKACLAGMSARIRDCFGRPKLTQLFEVRDTVAECLPTA